MTENETNGFAFAHALAAQMLHNTGGPRMSCSQMLIELPDAGKTAVNQRFSEINLCIF